MSLLLTDNIPIGDFEEIYGAEGDADTSEPQAGQWDAVLTCFFIDTASSLLYYIEIYELSIPTG